MSVSLFEKCVEIQFHSCNFLIAAHTRLWIVILLVLPLIGIRGNSGCALILFAFAMMNAHINSDITLRTKALTREAYLAARPWNAKWNSCLIPRSAYSCGFDKLRVSIGPRSGRLNCPIVSALNASREMSVGGDNATIMSAVILRIGTGVVNRYEKLTS